MEWGELYGGLGGSGGPCEDVHGGGELGYLRGVIRSSFKRVNGEALQGQHERRRGQENRGAQQAYIEKWWQETREIVLRAGPDWRATTPFIGASMEACRQVVQEEYITPLLDLMETSLKRTEEWIKKKRSGKDKRYFKKRAKMHRKRLRSEKRWGPSQQKRKRMTLISQFIIALAEDLWLQDRVAESQHYYRLAFRGYLSFLGFKVNRRLRSKKWGAVVEQEVHRIARIANLSEMDLEGGLETAASRRWRLVALRLARVERYTDVYSHAAGPGAMEALMTNVRRSLLMMLTRRTRTAEEADIDAREKTINILSHNIGICDIDIGHRARLRAYGREPSAPINVYARSCRTKYKERSKISLLRSAAEEHDVDVVALQETGLMACERLSMGSFPARAHRARPRADPLAEQPRGGLATLGRSHVTLRAQDGQSTDRAVEMLWTSIKSVHRTRDAHCY